MHGLKQNLLIGGLAACFSLLSVVSPSMAAASVAQTVSNTTSIYGYDQYETAAKIAKNGWTGTSDYAILAAGMPANLIDALAAGPLAAKLNAPIILTEGNDLNQNAKEELTRLKVKKVYVTSGSAVIKKNVLDEVKTIETVTEVKDLGGIDASQTSVNIAKEMANQGVKISQVVVTGGAGSDALSVAAIAGAQGMPILYTNGSSLSAYVKDYLEGVQANVKQTYVIGGPAVISETAKAQIPGTVERYYGQTQYDTNLEVLENFAGAKNKTTYLANGETMVDALAGVPLAVKNDALILLTGKTLPEASNNYAQSNLLTNVIGLGGPAVVSEDALNSLVPSEVISQDGSSKGSDDSQTLEKLNGILKVTGNNVTVKNAKTDYSVYVQGDNVTLNNLTVNGTIFLDPGDNGTATLQDVTATNIVILSGGPKGINLVNVNAQLLDNQSSSPDVLINATGSTKIERTVASSSASFQAVDGTSFGKIKLSYFPQSQDAAPVVNFMGNNFPSDMIEVGDGVQVIQNGGVSSTAGGTDSSSHSNDSTGTTTNPTWNSGDSFYGNVTETSDNTYGPSSGLFSVAGDMTLGGGSNTSMTLQNVKVSGTLTLNPGPTGSVTLNNVTAENVVVQSGADHSIDLIGVTIADTLTVNAPNQTPVRIVTQGSTMIGNTLVQSAANLVNNSTGSNSSNAFGDITLNVPTSGATVQLGGTISSPITVGSSASNLLLEATNGALISGPITVNSTVSILADSTATINNVQVAGPVSLSVQGTGTVSAVSTTSAANNATISIAAGTTVPTVTLSASVTINAASGATIGDVQVAAAGIQPILSGSGIFTLVTVTAEATGATVTVDSGTHVAAITADVDFTLAGNGTVDVVTPATGVTVTQSNPQTVTDVTSPSPIEAANGTLQSAIGLPNTVTVNLSGGGTADVNVTWDNGTPTYDGTTAGTYTFSGTLSNLPFNVTNPNQVTASVSVTVDSAVVQSQTVTGISSLSPIAVANGTTQGAIGLPNTVTVNLSGGGNANASLTWDNGTPTYDGTTAGTYTFTGALSNLPANVTNPNQLTANVSVTVGQIVTGVTTTSPITVANGTTQGAIGLPSAVMLNLSAPGHPHAIANVTWDNGTPSYDGLTSGTYTFSGTLSNLPANVTNPNQVTASINVVVTADSTTPSALSFSNQMLPNATEGMAYSAVLSAQRGTGGYTFAIANGSTTPAGLTLSPNGILSGIPTTPGSYCFEVTVTDSGSTTASAIGIITIEPQTATSQPLTFTVTSLPSTINGMYYSAGFDVAGGTGTYNYDLVPGSSLPAGLTLNDGILSGIPTSAGSSTFSVIVTDSSGSNVTQQFTLNVN
ncbi:cell wall-binding repeat-containing protein [Desulfosporosinus sp. FKA]|uniref:cell wall-binding repeat-containing protein n=1 Tax=Desulfosporosinus sp. FKA TaxID=1969834 RepID=UPI000B4A1EF9|nr:cell wall-binding repeat-containing protein [Desulfosporosinus sp. FKA]